MADESTNKHDTENPYGYRGFANRHSLMLASGVALVLYALPSLETPYFWVALVAAFIACKISSQHAYQQVKTIFRELARSLRDAAP